MKNKRRQFQSPAPPHQLTMEELAVALRRDHSLDYPDITQLNNWARTVATSFETKRTFRDTILSRSSYKRKRLITGLPSTCQGTAGGKGEDAIRLLAVVGIMNWAKLEHPSSDISVFLTHTLWPLVIVPHLPDDWFDSLQEIASSELAIAVQHARVAVNREGPIVHVQEFARELNQGKYRVGLRNLLDDLNDPRRGGFAFSSVFQVAGLPQPPKKLTLKQLCYWLGGFSVSGIIGNNADRVIGHLWTQLTASGSMLRQGHDEESGTFVRHTNHPAERGQAVGSHTSAHSALLTSGGQHPVTNSGGHGPVQSLFDWIESIVSHFHHGN